MVWLADQPHLLISQSFKHNVLRRDNGEPLLERCSASTLNSHAPVELGIGGTVDLAHVALADLFDDLVMAHGRSDHNPPPLPNVRSDFNPSGG